VCIVVLLLLMSGTDLLVPFPSSSPASIVTLLATGAA
jgi:hypothetical protein